MQYQFHSMFAESDANKKELAVYEQAHIYETISDPAIGDSHHDIVELQDVATDTYPQPLMTAELDKSTQKQEQRYLQRDINISNTNCHKLSSTIHRHDTPSRSSTSVDTSKCLHAESYHYEKVTQYYEKIPSSDVNEENDQDAKTPYSDAKQTEAASEDLEQNTRSHDQQVGHYEMINRYEKVPHCDLSLITSAQRTRIIHDERYYNEENGKDAKTPCSDAKQIEASSEDLEQNTRSHDLQVDKRGHYDQICQYERISHYEKVPHCDLSLIASAQRKQARDVKWPQPT